MGDAREVHHIALLLGFGAGAVNPYLAFESIEDLIAQGLYGLAGADPNKAIKNYIKACGKGVLKIMSKMGISTIASYRGARVGTPTPSASASVKTTPSASTKPAVNCDPPFTIGANGKRVYKPECM